MSDAPELHYRAGLAAGELRYQWCSHCLTAVFYPRVLCPGCSTDALEWRVSQGMGTVYSTTTTRSRDGARNLALIDLDEGYRMMSRITGDPDTVHIGQRVRLSMGESAAGDPQAAFEPVTEANRQGAS